MGEEAAEVSEGEVVQGEAATDGTNIRKGRSLSLALGAAKLTGAVVGGHIGKKLGFGTGLAIGLGAKKHASKDEDHPVHLKKAHAAPIVHHKHHLKTEKSVQKYPLQAVHQQPGVRAGAAGEVRKTASEELQTSPEHQMLDNPSRSLRHCHRHQV